jgi:LmbE family N-acetylglucosaminyl deacetylase
MAAGRRQKVARLVADEGIMAALPILVRIASQWRPREERSRRIKANLQRPATAEVEVGRWVTRKQAALAEHRTQFRPDPAQLRYLSFATEQFTLRESRVEVNLPEKDLFAGLRSGSRTEL